MSRDHGHFPVAGIVETLFLGAAAIGAAQLAGGRGGVFVGFFKLVAVGFICVALLVMCSANQGHQQQVQQQQTAAAAAKVAEAQRQSDLAKCGPPDPRWTDIERYYLTVCEAAMAPPIVADGTGNDVYYGSARAKALHERLQAEADAKAERERYNAAVRARQEWLRQHGQAVPVFEQPAPPAPLAQPMELHPAADQPDQAPPQSSFEDFVNAAPPISTPNQQPVPLQRLRRVPRCAPFGPCE